jgi:hypothetical protein
MLSLIEAALPASARTGAITRSVDYRKGIARMTFMDGSGGIVLHNFLLADGQLCMRVALHRTGVAEPGETFIYPKGRDFDWMAEAGRVALVWGALVPLGEPSARAVA